MKKLFASIAALLLWSVTSSASAQTLFDGSENGEYRIGIQLGFNAPTFGGDQYKSTIGWNFGVTSVLNTESFIPDSYLRGSLLYTRKGAAAGMDAPMGIGTIHNLTTYQHYLELPIHFGYAYALNDLVTLMGETGPYFGFRASGSVRFDNMEISQFKKDQVKKYFPDIKRFDWGWGIHAGVMLVNKYQLMVGYDWGLSNIAPTAGINKNFTINLAVYFD